MKKKQFYPIIFLTCLTLVMIIVITPSSSIFGANTDWLSQHVNLADYIRKTMLETKSFSPILHLISAVVKIFIIYLIMDCFDLTY